MKFSKHAILILLCGSSLLTTDAPAQENEPHSIRLGFGGSDYHVKDDHASPLIYRSIGIAPTIQYLYRSGDRRLYGEISYYHNDLETSTENFHTTSWRGRVRFSYLQSVLKFQALQQPFEFFLGGSIGSFFTKAEYFYAIPTIAAEGRTVASWYWSHSVDAAAYLEYQPGHEQLLSIQLWMPILSNVSRPQYSSSGDYNYDENDWKIKGFGQTEFLPRNLSIDVLITYQRSFLAGFDVHLSYEFFSSSYDRPTSVNMYMNNLRTGLSYRF